MGTLYQRADRGGSAGKWYAEYLDGSGKRIKRCTGTRNRRDAMKILLRWEDDAFKVLSGEVDQAAVRHSQQLNREIVEHLDEWYQSLETKQRSEQYVFETRSQWEAILAATEWRTLAHIQPEDLERYASKLQKTGRYKNSQNRSARTVAKYIQTVRRFLRWAIKTGRLRSDPLAAVETPNPETDRRLRRRMLLPSEWPHLKQAAESCSRYGVPPEDRALIYELAIVTGLRSNEIRSLQIHNLSLKAKPPFVSLTAAQTKNRKACKQIITLELAQRLAARIKQAGKSGKDPLFTLCFDSNIAKMVRADLLAAREAWIGEAKTDKAKQTREKSDFLASPNHAGEQFDFHALRHTCGAWLSMQGVHPKTVQAVMRHSTIKLTLDNYGHLMPGADEQAVDRISRLFSG